MEDVRVEERDGRTLSWKDKCAGKRAQRGERRSRRARLAGRATTKKQGSAGAWDRSLGELSMGGNGDRGRRQQVHPGR